MGGEGREGGGRRGPGGGEESMLPGMHSGSQYKTITAEKSSHDPLRRPEVASHGAQPHAWCHVHSVFCPSTKTTTMCHLAAFLPIALADIEPQAK